MSNIREALIIAGWFISLWISFNAFKRAEIYRAKDKIIDRIDKMHEWIVKEIKSIKSEDEKNKMLQIIESFAASKLSQLELSAVQYNKFARYNIVDLDMILELRSIDFTEGNVEDTINLLNQCVYNFSESIEENFSRLSNGSIFEKLNRGYHDLKAIFFTLLSIWLLFKIFEIYF